MKITLKSAVIVLCLLASVATAAAEVTVGAARTGEYVPRLRGKRVALFSNHTGMGGDPPPPGNLL